MNVPHLSFEFFPPKTADGAQKLRTVAQTLAETNPEFFSVTFGAGGTTQTGTRDTLLMLQTQTAIPTAAHLTCVGATRDNLKTLLDDYLAHDIRRIVALRGDLPAGMPDAGEFKYAIDLVKFIRESYSTQFHIEVAAYPEFHPNLQDNPALDLQNFIEKYEAGANSAITQYFFNADAYFNFCEKINKYNPNNFKIIPGIMPITNFKGLQRFSQSCGAEIPRWLALQLAEYENAGDLLALKQLGSDFMAQLCQQLLAGGAPSLHFYTLNQSEASLNILEKI